MCIYLLVYFIIYLNMKIIWKKSPFNGKYIQHHPKNGKNFVINERSKTKFELIQNWQIFEFDNLKDAKNKAEEDFVG